MPGPFEKAPQKIDFAAEEKKILQLWETLGAFEG